MMHELTPGVYGAGQASKAELTGGRRERHYSEQLAKSVDLFVHGPLNQPAVGLVPLLLPAAFPLYPATPTR